MCFRPCTDLQSCSSASNPMYGSMNSFDEADGPLVLGKYIQQLTVFPSYDMR